MIWWYWIEKAHHVNDGRNDRPACEYLAPWRRHFGPLQLTNFLLQIGLLLLGDERMGGRIVGAQQELQIPNQRSIIRPTEHTADFSVLRITLKRSVRVFRMCRRPRANSGRRPTRSQPLDCQPRRRTAITHWNRIMDYISVDDRGRKLPPVHRRPAPPTSHAHSSAPKTPERWVSLTTCLLAERRPGCGSPSRRRRRRSSQSTASARYKWRWMPILWPGLLCRRCARSIMPRECAWWQILWIIGNSWH